MKDDRGYALRNLENRLSLDLIIMLLIIAGVESNPGPPPCSPQRLIQFEMQKKSSKDEEKENQLVEILSEEYYQIEEDRKQLSESTKNLKIPVSEPESHVTDESQYTLKSIYELIQDKFCQLNIEIQSIKSEENKLKEENKNYKEEMNRISQKLQELDEKSKK
ncbi:uncharacterized protein PF3D7_1120000-like [Centruroides vittatus]|uniref:uncharacterized protein PF3D7_1120000-like n=1 Tax=Centruroides vittatus TaxID=120091 RepID=UPI0035100DDC